MTNEILESLRRVKELPWSGQTNQTPPIPYLLASDSPRIVQLSQRSIGLRFTSEENDRHNPRALDGRGAVISESKTNHPRRFAHTAFHISEDWLLLRLVDFVDVSEGLAIHVSMGVLVGLCVPSFDFTHRSRRSNVVNVSAVRAGL